MAETRDLCIGDSSSKRILLVDDHTLVREGISRLLASACSAWRITEARAGFAALELLNQQHFDLVITDLSLPGMSGLDLIRRIRRLCSDVPVVVLSMHREDQYAVRAIQAGASAYVTKDSASDELVAAAQQVLSGGVFLKATAAQRLVQQLNGVHGQNDLDSLTDREMDIMERIVSGERMTDIAHALHLSIKTVSTHKTHILQKLKLDSTAALIRYGLESKTIDSLAHLSDPDEGPASERGDLPAY